MKWSKQNSTHTTGYFLLGTALNIIYTSNGTFRSDAKKK
jgi:hypothetical protein